MKYRQRDVEAITGASRRQLQWWKRSGLVRPSSQTPGGQTRYAPADVRRIVLLLTVTGGERMVGRKQPISIRKAARILDALHGKVEAMLELAIAEERARVSSERLEAISRTSREGAGDSRSTGHE